MTDKKTLTDLIRSLKDGESVRFDPSEGNNLEVLVSLESPNEKLTWSMCVCFSTMHPEDQLTGCVQEGLRNVRNQKKFLVEAIGTGKLTQDKELPIDRIKRSTLEEIKKSMSPGIAGIFDMVIRFVDVSDVKKGTELSLTYQALAVGMLHGMFLGLTQLLDTENASDIGRRLEAIDLMKDETMESLRNLAAYGETRKDKVSRFMDDMEAFFNRGSGPC